MDREENLEMVDHQHKITEVRLPQTIVVLLAFFICVEGLVSLFELLRPTFPLGYQRSALVLAVGFTVGAVIGGGLTSLLRSRIAGSLVTPIRSWQVEVGFWLLLLLWGGIPYLLSQACMPLWDEAMKSPTTYAAASDCFTRIQMLRRLWDGFVCGILVWTYIWAVVQERNRKGQLIIAVHSARRGWPVENTLIAIGFAILVIYVFYRIFNLR
jgi:hypothetical protein